MEMKIGWTIGCWDLFHEGHENFLRIASKQCDVLIVAVTTDWLTMMQKGHERPLRSLRQRMMDIIDWSFQEGITNLKIVPVGNLKVSYDLKHLVDVIFYGPDQAGRFYGLEENRFATMKLIPRTPDISTTMLVNLNDPT
jgi:cytidyltransferase-like protein